MKRIDIIAAFGAAVVSYRCTELGLHVYVAIATGTAVGALTAYALRKICRRKRHCRMYRPKAGYQRVRLSNGRVIWRNTRVNHKRCADRLIQPERKQTVTLKGAILARLSEGELRAFYTNA